MDELVAPCVPTHRSVITDMPGCREVDDDRRVRPAQLVPLDDIGERFHLDRVDVPVCVVDLDHGSSVRRAERLLVGEKVIGPFVPVAMTFGPAARRSIMA
jgi:hypothetical protein